MQVIQNCIKTRLDQLVILFLGKLSMQTIFDRCILNLDYGNILF